MGSLRYEREKESIRQYRLNNQEKIKELKKQWYLKNRKVSIKEPVTREDQLVRMRQWRIDNKDRFNTARNRWTVDNKDRVRDMKVKYEFSKQLGCTSSDIPIDLLEAKLSIIKVKRKVKELLK